MAFRHTVRDIILHNFSRVGLLGRASPIVLMYHSVNTSWDRMGMTFDRFERHIRRLHRDGVQFLRLDDLERVQRGEITGPAVLLTFDDGLQDNAQYAIPLLRELRIPAVFFISTELVGKPFIREQFHCLDWDGVREIAADPLFEIGSHTQTHPRCTSISFDACRTELLESKRSLEEQLNCAIRSFAFPFGAYVQEHVALAEQIGYRYIFTGKQRRLSRNFSLSEVPRFVVNQYTAPHVPAMMYPGYEWYWRIYEKTYKLIRRKFSESYG